MAVSSEEVQWCYRLLLGREPESERVVQERLATANRFELVSSFLDSTEFQNRQPDHQHHSSALNRFDAAPSRVDVQVTAAQLAALLQRVKTCWTALGETQPHWSVMSNEQFRPAHIEASAQKFWNSGEQEMKKLKRILDRIGCGELAQKTCVEYGCGMGRITAHLAGLFGAVQGYDISSSHLQHARARVQSLGLANVTFDLVADDPLAALRPCDVYFTHITLQHNPPPLIRQLIANALQALKPSGVAVFQVPTYLSGYRFDIHEYLGAPPDRAHEFEMHCLPQAAVYQLLVEHGCQLLEVHEDGAAGTPKVCVSNLFVVQKPGVAA